MRVRTLVTPRLDSPANTRVVAAARAIARGERLALESPRLLLEALDAGVDVEEVLHDGGADSGAAVDRARAAGVRTTLVSSRVLAKLTELGSPRGLVALAPIPARAPDSIPASFGLVLDGVQDPVNVGALLRSGEAFGASGAVLTPGCASPFSPRALRASAGSAFRLPVAAGATAGEAVAWAKRSGAALVGAVARGGVDPRDVPAGPLVLAVGSEGRGLGPEVEGALDVRVTIPMSGGVESLNAAVAGGVLLYALARPAGVSPNTSASKR